MGKCEKKWQHVVHNQSILVGVDQSPRSLFMTSDFTFFDWSSTLSKLFLSCLSIHKAWDNSWKRNCGFLHFLDLSWYPFLRCINTGVFLSLDSKPVSSLSLPLSHRRCSCHQVTLDSIFSQHPTRIIIHSLLTLTVLMKSLLC